MNIIQFRLLADVGSAGFKKLSLSLLLTTALASGSPVWGMDEEKGHALPGNAKLSRSSASQNDPQEEQRQFSLFRGLIDETLASSTNPTLQAIVKSLNDDWNQNLPHATIRDETQLSEHAKKRARALEQMKDLTELLKAGMEVKLLAEIYKQLFDEQNQTDDVLEKKGMILRHSVVLFPTGMKGNDRAKIIKELLKGDVTQIQAIAQNAGSLFTPEMRGDEYSRIIKIALKINATEIELRATAISQNAVALFTPTMDIYGRSAIIVAALELGANEIGLRANAISRNAETLFTPGMKARDCGYIIEELLKGDVTQIQAIAQNAVSLFTPEMDGFTCSRIIETAFKLDAAEISRRATAISQNASMLFPHDMYANSKGYMPMFYNPPSWIIMAALEVDAMEIGPRAVAISKNIGALFTPTMTGTEHSLIIARALQFNAEEIVLRVAAISQNKKAFFPPNMDGCKQAFIIETLLQGDVPQIQVIAQNAETLFTPDMNNGTNIVIGAIHLDASEIGRRAAAICQNADKLFPPGTRNEDRAKDIEKLLKGDEAQMQVIFQKAASLYEMDIKEEEDKDRAHHPSNSIPQSTSAPIDDSPEEERQFNLFKDLVDAKLQTSGISSPLPYAFKSLKDVWNQNQPIAAIIDETQTRKRAQRRARALDQMKDFYEPLKAGMNVKYLEYIYNHLFSSIFESITSQLNTLFEKKRMILRHSASLFTLDELPYLKIIEAALNLDVTQIGPRAVAISQSADILFPQAGSYSEREMITAALIEVNDTEIGPRAVAISQNAEKLFTPTMKSFYRAKITTAALGVNAAWIPSRAAAIFKNARILFTSDMGDSSRAEITAAALGVKGTELGPRAVAISQNAGTLFTPNMSGFQHATITAAALQVNADEIGPRAIAISQNAGILFTPNMSDSQRTTITVAALQVNAEKIGPRAIAISQNSGTLFLPNMHAKSCAMIIAAALQVNAREIGPRAIAISQNAGTLFTANMSDNDRALIIAVLLRANAIQIQTITQNARSLFSSKMVSGGYPMEESDTRAQAERNTFYRALLLETLLRGNAAQIQAILQNAGALFTPDMDDSDRAQIIEKLLKCDAVQIQVASTLFTPNMNINALYNIIEEFVTINKEASPNVSEINWERGSLTDEVRIWWCISFLRNENPYHANVKAAFEALFLDEAFRNRSGLTWAIARSLGEEHPIAQDFIQLGLGMENQHNPNSFLAIHQEMLAKRGQTVLHKPRVMDDGVTFNTAMTQEPRPRGDAKLILKSQWKQMVTNLEAFRTQQEEGFEALGVELPSDLQALKEHVFLLGLLNEENTFRVPDHISVVSYQFREVLDQILWLSRRSEDDKVSANLLCAQLLSSIQYCRTGKADGISQIYRLLRNEKMLEEDEIGTERFVEEIRTFFQNEFRRMREGAIARVVDIVCPHSQFNDNARVHGKAYVKGVLGEELGLYFKGEKPSIDMDGNCVPSVLRKKSKQELLNLAYLYYKPEDVIDRVHVMLNNGQIKIEGQEGDVLTIAILNMFLSNEKKLDPNYTVFQDDGVTPKGLTRRAAKEILLKIGVLVTP